VAAKRHLGALVMSEQELDRLFGELCAGARAGGGAARAPADVYVTGDPPALVLELAVPGLDVGTLQITLEDDLLQVRGERRRRGGQRRAYEHAEIEWGPFVRRLSLGRAVDAEAATAGYEDGILRLHLPFAPRRPAGRVIVALRV
jgi:HSP20 family protein